MCSATNDSEEIARLRAELAAERKLREHETKRADANHESLTKHWLNEGKLRSALVKAGEALENLAKHCNDMEAQNCDYHALGEHGMARISQPLATAYDTITEIRKLLEGGMKIEDAIEDAIDAYLIAEMPPDIKRAAFLASLRANGYVVVPLNINTKMLMALVDQWESVGNRTMSDNYAAMLAAAQDNDDG